ncbi:DUF2157 domain-containing protein [uncultured Ilyobacter sp.]|uniref:DUF2157 domain-containing protein n=1 Tax=uncultured Ilyobacter sp. TaxID=544433 RepID=UPI0029F5C72F|nr:DUF2157 domain-containing protein [uncultured Ilyobacter sp.]
MRGKIVLKELERLRGLGVITDEIYKGIEEFYASQGDNRKTFFNFFITAGCLLIGLGIILLFAYNWSKIGRGIKTGILVSSVLTGQLFFYFSLEKKREFVSGAGVFLTLMVGLSIAMISQMYNVSGEDRGFYLAWGTLSIPVLYFTRGGINSLIYAFVLYMYQSSDGYILIYMLLGVPIFLFSRKKGGMGALVETTSKVLFLIGIMVWYGKFSDNSKAGLLVYSALFAGAYTLPLGLKKIGEQLTIIMAYFLTFKKDYIFNQELVYDKVFWLSAVFYIIVLVLLLLRKADFKNIILWNILLIILPLFFSWSFIVYNIYFLIIGGSFIFEGFKRGDVRIFNSGSLIVGGLIATRFLDYKISTLTRGIVFIVLGGALIAGNLYMSRKRGGSIEK